MPIRLVLAEDNVLLREGLVRVFNGSDGVDLVAACGSLDELLASVTEHRPDVVLTDIRMPPTSTNEGIRAAAEFRRDTRTWASSCSASTPTRRTPTTSSPRDRAGGPTC